MNHDEARRHYRDNNMAAARKMMPKVMSEAKSEGAARQLEAAATEGLGMTAAETGKLVGNSGRSGE